MIGRILTRLSNVLARRGRPKVFCIGFNKTGTTTLHSIFSQLGLRSIHGDIVDDRAWKGNFQPFPSEDLIRRRSIEASERGTWVEGNVGLLRYHYDCFSDGENHNYARLTQEFPDSRFILNVRPLDAWIVSRIKHTRKLRETQPPRIPPHHPSCPVRTGDYESSVERDATTRCSAHFEPCRCDESIGAIRLWVKKRNAYHESVLQYFRRFPNRLVIVDVTDPAFDSSEVNAFVGVSPKRAIRVHAAPGEYRPGERAELLGRVHTVLGGMGIADSEFEEPLVVNLSDSG